MDIVAAADEEVEEGKWQGDTDPFEEVGLDDLVGFFGGDTFQM